MQQPTMLVARRAIACAVALGTCNTVLAASAGTFADLDALSAVANGVHRRGICSNEGDGCNRAAAAMTDDEATARHSLLQLAASGTIGQAAPAASAAAAAAASAAEHPHASSSAGLSGVAVSVNAPSAATIAANGQTVMGIAAAASDGDDGVAAAESAVAAAAQLQEEGLAESVLLAVNKDDSDGEVRGGSAAEPASSREVREIVLKVAAPLGSVACGLTALLVGQELVGLTAIYFGIQTGMVLFMKFLFSDLMVTKDLYGIPAPFLITSVQQVIVFAVTLPASLYAAFGATASATTERWTKQWWLTVTLFSFAFTASIGLNNLSLSLIPISLNLVIRSTLPLVTLLGEFAERRFLYQQHEVGGADEPEGSTTAEVCMILLGVACAGIAAVASHKSPTAESSSAAYLCGVLVCFLSTSAAALQLMATKLLGHRFSMSPVDATTYTSLPCAFTSFVPAIVLEHPTVWKDMPAATDWQVMRRAWHLDPAVPGWIALAGLSAAGFNIFLYTLVNRLSPAHAALCGNFNKAATVSLSLILGLETLPGGAWSVVLILAICGNLGSFASYSYLQISRPGPAGLAAGASVGGESTSPKP